MKFPVILLGAALYLLSSVEADISTNTPFNGVSWKGGEDEDVKWTDNGKAPTLQELAKSGKTTVDLMAGGPNNQIFVATIGKVLATEGEIEYDVPKTIGPSGDFYFIRYTTGKSTSFSGTFSITGVDGKIAGLDPKNPNAKALNAAAPATPGTPGAPAPAPDAVPPTNPYTAPKVDSTPKTDPKAAASPTVPAAPAPTPSTDLPNSLSNSAAYNFPSFAGVATAAVAFAFTYLY